MKIFISADIEGITGIGHWNETDKAFPNEYSWFQKQMTAEVAAAAEAAIEGGATEILIKDAHDSGRNLILDELPELCNVVRGWAGHPLSMVQEVDASFDAIMFIGYHSRAGQNTNTLAHTMSSARIARMTLNGQDMSEFYVHGLAASYYGVPSIFVSGDEGLCQEVAEHNSTIETVATIKGEGSSVISQHPAQSLKMIRAGVAKAIGGDFSKGLLSIPDKLEFSIEFKKHQEAYRASFYPGANLINPVTVGFKTEDYFELLRFNLFAY
ncbi:MAG: amino acid amidase [Candidatus Marinimicrobia bacterium]|jgi:D-amino peptidase|nr:amino acid amidase [Candidatus Neomarinimicrobiota bacterium]MBT3576504.1 amino acid amidase [Candidatus Neomarinimicrobiota bacterium]MBT3681290.1 amino acid amidase [Candidatus Neomarinimicrobiota bacterium]MBT3951504.1 amino acid amidase [Candidatus Neomarinimicrobiota bacterium]MBT4253896.1 amino acid amidase [Candidatus Neomarinimicrobiota bacterium]